MCSILAVSATRVTEEKDRLVEEFARDGVAVVRRLFDHESLGELVGALEDYESEILPSLPRGDYTLEPDGRTVRNLWRMQEHSSFFREFAARPELVDLVAPLLGAGDVESLGVESFSKPARVGSAVPYHQDNAYFCLEPADVLTLWVALDAVTSENGAVEYLLGSHRELQPHAPSGVKGNSFGLRDPPEEGAFPRAQPTLEAGDAIVHHGLVIHQSPPNRSPRSRRAVIVVYRGAHTRVQPRLLAEYQRAQAITPHDA